MIEVRGLAKRFGGTEALRDVSFMANDGSITGLLGANGAGKSTTLRIIAQLLEPDRGTVRMGEDASLGALLDHAGLYGRLTARENLAYFGELHGFSAAQANELADEALRQLGLEAEANRRVAGFSFGQRAKVALGRAIVHGPQNLLLDEPTNGLDVPSMRALRAVLRKMRDGGCCIVFSSHVLDEVAQLCDRIVILAKGAVAGAGSPAEIQQWTKAGSLEEAFVQLTEGAEA